MGLACFTNSVPEFLRILFHSNTYHATNQNRPRLIFALIPSLINFWNSRLLWKPLKLRYKLCDRISRAKFITGRTPPIFDGSKELFLYLFNFVRVLMELTPFLNLRGFFSIYRSYAYMYSNMVGIGHQTHSR